MSFSDRLGKWYRVVGLSIYRDLSHEVIHRITYDGLAFLGDVGGLYEFCFAFITLLLQPFLMFTNLLKFAQFLFFKRNKKRQQNFSSLEELGK